MIIGRMMMTISFPELKEKWDGIDKHNENYILASAEHPLLFHIGYNNVRQKSFVIYNTGKIESIPTSKAISAKCIKAESGIYSLQFSLQYPSLSDVFMLLCWDLMDNSFVDVGAIETLLERYKKWQKLLQKANSSLLSTNEIKGLIGELFFLSRSIDVYGEEIAICGWLGPDGADQDFIFADKWVEVKTVTISSDDVNISSLQQLDRSDKGYLVVYFMDKTSSNATKAYSLTTIVKEVEEKLKSQQLKDKLWCKLAQRGCLKYQIERYSETVYRTSEERVYKVDSTFPRLLRANVPVEVTSVKYMLSLAAIEKYRDKSL